MRSIIISSNCSGGGKTTFTLGLMKVLKSRNFHVQGYKVGPDYIDTAFHKAVTGIASRNLDTFLMGEEGVKKSFQKGSGNIGIIEGVMGLYDGIGASEKGSTYHVSKLLGNMPIVLVLSPKGQSASICAEISGFKNYKDSNIVGVVLNSVSEKYYNLLKYAIEKNCNIKVFGYIPKTPEIALSSRHLGLVQSMEILNLEEKLDICANLMEKYVDIDGIINATQEYKISTDGDLNNSFKEDDKQKSFESLKEESRNRNLKIGVALDKAFSFYYKDNLEALENLGEIVYFSPINDKELPQNLDFLYIGGGYPEVFKKELENNYSMRKSIKEALDGGLRCYAECGGLMYLTESIDGSEMVGFFNGDSTMTNKLQNFGYCNVKIDNKCFDNKGLEDNEFEVNAHEFHKSKVDLDEDNVYDVEKTLYNGEVLKWKCGYFKNNTLGGYAHINFLGNEELLKALVNY
ncbi:cobyrinate a,c-diamide synthase [Clostridium beijerinckii]|jgi:hydrogenobyrinic acid a,c-diamide synthase (glutamine-hydrolysing) (EC 6.3.5.9)/cobyrinate a,c-diamide synthase (EC 6.3.5.-)|uniref:Cobyrinate a,c-diamide synthase n=2 Tax=Clostridium beijerinckii TaxID=1520 RepID=A0AAE2V1Y4_CLOBE|nr:cobyrinate a,c-diamide synthase [Clostridium beijerinckii]ABR34470.1 cobyrinic acid a,c-diamide synthase [Clostridium beijerinckii NCIMB 8052]AIU04055.1 cobyrinic acid a,c-diamide synthase [Clostridium beijerinckii ATCC 35702]MBF7810908.1 cobyrinate a,c-diamide synthase [Clostridium beijerinckii]NOW91636.1 cobyrinic acid a,c-diamide synthase [Clostridium beijerinckii]NRT24195.1 cobyrinic acid a,c-diamide synthase [Clostridium beijerinckii]